MYRLIGIHMGSASGDIGRVEDFYFDEQNWAVRYLIIKTGSWMFGRKVLISPDVLGPNAWDSGILPVTLTKDQIQHSPRIDTEKLVSRQQEGELASYYAWTNYWEQAPSIPAQEDFRLKSTRQVTGYYIHGSDGIIGQISDYIMDDQTWQISYLVVDTHSLFGGKKILLALKHIREVQWANSKLLVDISVDTIKKHLSADNLGYIIPETDQAEYQEQFFV